MRVREAEWCAMVPWRGIQDKPAFLDNPDGQITIDDVEGLREALANRPDLDLARVAYTGNYNDLTNLPALGSAAFAEVSDFLSAPTLATFETGEVAFVASQQSYVVTFTAVKQAIPKIYTQVLMADDNGEVFFATLAEDSITISGFKFWLNGIPTLSTGKCRWKATVEDNP